MLFTKLDETRKHPHVRASRVWGCSLCDQQGRDRAVTGAGVGSAADLAELRYRRLVDHSPNAICVHEGGRVVYVNAAAVRWMAARSSDQLVGHPITEFVHPDSVPAGLGLV
jgi:PAS domain-containing protein